MNLTTDDAKAAARALRTSLATSGVAISHARALELVAHQMGHRDWNAAHAALSPTDLSSPTAAWGPAVPVIRIQDERLAREFYLEYLGLATEWEHRFEPGMPLYLRARRGEVVLDLSEHHGDGVPGSVTWIPVRDIRSLLRELASRPHPRLRPGIDRDAPGGPTIELPDPFGNVLRLCQPAD